VLERKRVALKGGGASEKKRNAIAKKVDVPFEVRRMRGLSPRLK